MTYGEGPCIDAHRTRLPILEPDLASSSTACWPAFTRAAADRGVQAVFAFPIHVGPVHLDALTLHRSTTGPLTMTQFHDVIAVADSAARTIIESHTEAVPGSLGAELEPGTTRQFVVHQATGMVAAQLGVSAAAALVRLRGHAFTTDQLIVEVAEDIVTRRARMSDEDETDTHA